MEKNRLQELAGLLTESSLLLEKEEDEEEEADVDLFGDDAGEGDAAAEGGDEPEDEGEPEAEEAEEEEDEEEEPEKEEPPEPVPAIGDEVDRALGDVIMDFAKDAIDVASAKKEMIPESSNLLRFLMEAEEPDIDVPTFADDVARLIDNYENLIDMEALIFNKSYEFLEMRYGKDYADQMEDILLRQYGLELDHDSDPEIADQNTYAIGASPDAAEA